MSMHLFPTPVECTNCGTVVDDPTVDKCPHCGALLKERRTPARLAGVERKYGNIRFLLSLLRFLALAMFLVAVLVLVFSDASVPWTILLLSGLVGIIPPVGLLVIAALMEVALDIEENTRASFRLQQMLLDAYQPSKAATHTDT